MNSDDDKLYIKSVVLDKIYNFVIEKFMNWNCLGSKEYLF
jgi:hypothetical protein